MLSVNNIFMSFKDKVIFEDFNCEFPSNSITGVLGSSGCGKSTLLRIIAGLIVPDKGEVVFDKNKIVKPNSDIFMMHQTYSNFPWKSCLENVLFPIKIKGKVAKEQIEEAVLLLHKVGLGSYINHYPHELSGGMKQRLALARTLMSKPSVILMDEPLSALDSKTRGDMQNLVLQLHHETKNTIIMVTHDPKEASKMCNQIINL